MNLNTICLASRAHQRGQAMVEFLITATFFLVPLFLAMVVMAKMSDVQHTTNMAGRYAAWERTVWYDDAGTKFNTHNGSNQKSAGEIGNEVAVRLLNDRSLNTSVIKNTDRSATTLANGIDPLWHDNQGKAYMDNFNQQSSAVTREQAKTDIAGGALKVFNALAIPGFVGTVVPPVPGDTLAIAEVKFSKIAENSQAYQRLWPKDKVWDPVWAGIDFKSTGAILSNSWYANGSQGTTAMVKESVPMANGLGKVAGEAALVTMKAWNMGYALGGPKAEIGKVAVDVVPGDRLK